MATTADGGTSVTLVVPPQQPVTPEHPVPPTPSDPSHVPFTGFELGAVLVLAAVLLAVGCALLAAGRRPLTRKA